MNLKNFKIDDQGRIEYEGTKPAIVDFWAEWCPPCKVMGPIFAEAAKVYGDRIDFYKVDVDKESKTSQEFAIRGVPAFYFVNPNKFVTIHVGTMTQEELYEIIENKLLGE
jgi:thioredoxin 1